METRAGIEPAYAGLQSAAMPHSASKVAVPEGFAPPLAGSEPTVLLLHQRTIVWWKTGDSNPERMVCKTSRFPITHSPPLFGRSGWNRTTAAGLFRAPLYS